MAPPCVDATMWDSMAEMAMKCAPARSSVTPGMVGFRLCASAGGGVGARWRRRPSAPPPTTGAPPSPEMSTRLSLHLSQTLLQPPEGGASESEVLGATEAQDVCHLRRQVTAVSSICVLSCCYGKVIQRWILPIMPHQR